MRILIVNSEFICMHITFSLESPKYHKMENTLHDGILLWPLNLDWAGPTESTPEVVVARSKRVREELVAN